MTLHIVGTDLEREIARAPDLLVHRIENFESCANMRLT
jgi:hypothetical protein